MKRRKKKLKRRTWFTCCLGPGNHFLSYLRRDPAQRRFIIYVFHALRPFHTKRREKKRRKKKIKSLRIWTVGNVIHYSLLPKKKREREKKSSGKVVTNLKWFSETYPKACEAEKNLFVIVWYWVIMTRHFFLQQTGLPLLFLKYKNRVFTIYFVFHSYLPLLLEFWSSWSCNLTLFMIYERRMYY